MFTICIHKDTWMIVFAWRHLNTCISCISWEIYNYLKYSLSYYLLWHWLLKFQCTFYHNHTKKVNIMDCRKLCLKWWTTLLLWSTSRLLERVRGVLVNPSPWKHLMAVEERLDPTDSTDVRFERAVKRTTVIRLLV